MSQSSEYHSFKNNLCSGLSRAKKKKMYNQNWFKTVVLFNSHSFEKPSQSSETGTIELIEIVTTPGYVGYVI